VRTVARWFFAGGPGSVVAFAAAIAALFFTLFPDYKPFSPTKLSAKVEVLEVERAVTRDQWRWRVAVGDPRRYRELVKEDARIAGGPKDEPCNVLGAAPGFTIYVATSAEGFKRHELTLRATLYKRASRERVEDVEEYRKLARVPIDAPTAESVQAVWLYDPGQAELYFARAELYDPDQRLLSIADSKPFRGISRKELAGMRKNCQSPIRP
jgi:hypothetical protein